MVLLGASSSASPSNSFFRVMWGVENQKWRTLSRLPTPPSAATPPVRLERPRMVPSLPVQLLWSRALPIVSLLVNRSFSFKRAPVWISFQGFHSRSLNLEDRRFWSYLLTRFGGRWCGRGRTTPKRWRSSWRALDKLGSRNL